MTVGPWKPIRLETHTTRVEELDVRVDVSENLDANFSATVSLSHDLTGAIQVDLKSPAGTVVGSERLELVQSKSATFSKSFLAKEIELWYPVGYGKQPLYTLEVSVYDKVYIGISIMAIC